MKSNKNILHDLIYLNTKGLNIWIHEANFYSRNLTDLQIAYTDDTNSSTSNFAKGLRLRFSFKGFKPHIIEKIIKTDPRNEITFYLDNDNAKKLKAFLIKNISDVK